MGGEIFSRSLGDEGDVFGGVIDQLGGLGSKVGGFLGLGGGSDGGFNLGGPIGEIFKKRQKDVFPMPSNDPNRGRLLGGFNG